MAGRGREEGRGDVPAAAVTQRRVPWTECMRGDVGARPAGAAALFAVVLALAVLADVLALADALADDARRRSARLRPRRRSARLRPRRRSACLRPPCVRRSHHGHGRRLLLVRGGGGVERLRSRPAPRAP
eukprot:4760588-Prymnesium_polylepis.1